MRNADVQRCSKARERRSRGGKREEERRLRIAEWEEPARSRKTDVQTRGRLRIIRYPSPSMRGEGRVRVRKQ